MDKVEYVKKLLIDSGIDFKKIPMEDMLTACEEYPGTISPDNYAVVTEAIKDIYNN